MTTMRHPLRFGMTAVVAAWSVIALAGVRADARAWAVLALLAALAVAFEAGAARVARSHRGATTDARPSLVPVWTVAAAVSLPPAQGVLLVGVVLGHGRLRGGSRARRPAIDWWFDGSTRLLALLGSGLAIRTGAGHWPDLPESMAGTWSVLVAIAVHVVVSRAVPTGSGHETLTELAGLCLGGLLGLTALDDPWLCVLVLVPMATLHRGALVRELQVAASTDAKTGLLNVAGWQMRAEQELARAARVGSSVAVLLIDIDRFKQINDRHGHLSGDAVLRSAARTLQSGVRAYDVVGRFGGDEFVVATAVADSRAALAVAERLRSVVTQCQVSVSIGVACSPMDGTQVAELLAAADVALYRAKAAGRNRVVQADVGAAALQRLVDRG